jgi:hypothetical protein
MDHRASVSGAAATRCSASARAVRRRPRRGARDGVSRRVSCVDGREFGLRSAPPFGTLLTTRPSRSSRRLRSARCDRCRGNGIAHNNCMAGGGAAPRPVRPALLVNSVRLLRNRARASSAILLRRGGAIDQGAHYGLAGDTQHVSGHTAESARFSPRVRAAATFPNGDRPDPSLPCPGGALAVAGRALSDAQYLRRLQLGSDRSVPPIRSAKRVRRIPL